MLDYVQGYVYIGLQQFPMYVCAADYRNVLCMSVLQITARADISHLIRIYKYMGNFARMVILIILDVNRCMLAMP